MLYDAVYLTGKRDLCLTGVRRVRPEEPRRDVADALAARIVFARGAVPVEGSQRQVFLEHRAERPAAQAPEVGDGAAGTECFVIGVWCAVSITYTVPEGGFVTYPNSLKMAKGVLVVLSAPELATSV